MIYQLASITYNSETGQFWRSLKHCTLPIRSVSHEGYGVTTLAGKQLRLARLAWSLVTGEKPDGEITYANGDKTDLRFDNLRLATRAEILRSRGPGRNSKTGIKGVQMVAHSRKFAAYVYINGKRTYLGSAYRTKEEAAKAVQSYCG